MSKQLYMDAIEKVAYTVEEFGDLVSGLRGKSVASRDNDTKGRIGRDYFIPSFKRGLVTTVSGPIGLPVSIGTTQYALNRLGERYNVDITAGNRVNSLLNPFTTPELIIQKKRRKLQKKKERENNNE